MLVVCRAALFVHIIFDKLKISMYFSMRLGKRKYCKKTTTSPLFGNSGPPIFFPGPLESDQKVATRFPRGRRRSADQNGKKVKRERGEEKCCHGSAVSACVNSGRLPSHTHTQRKKVSRIFPPRGPRASSTLFSLIAFERALFGAYFFLLFEAVGIKEKLPNWP